MDLNRKIHLHVLRPDGKPLYYQACPHADLPYKGYFEIYRSGEKVGENYLYFSSAENFLFWLMRVNDTNPYMVWVPTKGEMAKSVS